VYFGLAHFTLHKQQLKYQPVGYNCSSAIRVSAFLLHSSILALAVCG
jgi:hypothetical protein